MNRGLKAARSWLLVFGLCLATQLPGSGFSPDSTLVEFGPEGITLTEFERYLGQLHPNVSFATLPPEGQRKLLDDFVEDRLFAREARELGLDRLPDVSAEIDFLVERVLARAYRDAIAQSLEISEQEISRYYDSNRDELKKAPRYHIEHFVYREQQHALLARDALEAGVDYATVATEGRRRKTLLFSEREWLSAALLLPEVADAVRVLSRGDVSTPFESVYGTHVLRLVDLQPERQLDLEEARSQILEHLRREKSAAQLREELRKLKARHDVRLRLTTRNSP